MKCLKFLTQHEIIPTISHQSSISEKDKVLYFVKRQKELTWLQQSTNRAQIRVLSLKISTRPLHLTWDPIIAKNGLLWCEGFLRIEEIRQDRLLQDTQLIKRILGVNLWARLRLAADWLETTFQRLKETLLLRESQISTHTKATRVKQEEEILK